MSNFTKALKELTGFGDGENEELKDILPETDEELKFEEPAIATVNAEQAAPVVPEAPKKPEVVPAPAPRIPMNTIGAADSATFISRAMMITGNIKSEEDITLEGYIAGDIVTTQSFKSSGVQVGKVKANRLALNGAKHKGNIDVAEIAAIDTTSVVVGGIKCDSLKMDGRVKGDLDITNEALLLDNACIVGNVATGKINPAPGARISGNIVLRAVMEEIEDDFDFDIDFDFGGEN